MSRRKPDDAPVMIKKYANRRLYDTETSTYVTLEDLCEMVRKDREFIVQDAKTGEDLTRQILTQIILEQELKGAGMMPANFLRGVIRMHDEQMGGFVQQYLDASMKSFTANQDMFRDYVNKSMQGFGNINPLQQMEEISRRNIEVFQKTFEMFNPVKYFKDDEKK